MAWLIRTVPDCRRCFVRRVPCFPSLPLSSLPHSTMSAVADGSANGSDSSTSMLASAVADLAKIPAETGSRYPDPFRSAVEGRSRQRVGNALGLQNFGVNVTTLRPGAMSALCHWHTAQDEFVYVLSGELTLVMTMMREEGKDDNQIKIEERVLRAGEMAGFPAGVPHGHHLVNKSTVPGSYLEIGDRKQPDTAEYPGIDLKWTGNEFVKKSRGEAYPNQG